MLSGDVLSMARRRFRPAPPDLRVTATLVVALLAVPIALVVALTPSQFTLLLAAAGAAPIALMAGMRLPYGMLLAVAFVSPPLVQYLVNGSPEGIPAMAVVPIVGVEVVLLLRGLRYLRRSHRLSVVEVGFLAAMLYAAAIGLTADGDRRVWLGEFIETTNLVVMLWLLRLNRIGFADVRPLVLVGHVMAFPFFAWYLATRFGEYRLDFFFGLTTTLIPMTVAMLLHTRVSAPLRVVLLTSCFLMLVATAAAGIRGTTIIALLGTGLVVFFSLRRLSPFTLVSTATVVFALLFLQPVLMGVASRAAPEALERFQTVAESATLSVRVLEAQDAFEAFLARPAGHGLGAILVTRHEIEWGANGITVEYGPTTFVHNSYAWYLAKTGVVGFGALMLILASAVVAAIRRLSTTRGGASLALALLLAFITGAWGGPALHNVFYTPVLAFAIHLAYKQRAESSAATEDAAVRQDLPDRGPADRTPAARPSPPVHALRRAAR